VKNDAWSLEEEVPSGATPRKGSLGLEEDENGAHNMRSRAMRRIRRRSSFMLWQRKKVN